MIKKDKNSSKSFKKLLEKQDAEGLSLENI
jgi:hypothetical protein